MSMLHLVLVSLTLGAETVPADQAGAAPPADQVRSAIERAIPYVIEQGEKWIADRKCASCHQVPSMLWGLNAAKEKGVAVDEARLSGWVDWSLVHGATDKDGQPRDPQATDLDTLTQMILACSYGSHGAEADQVLANLADHVVRLQKDDGSWAPGGQLPAQKRQLRETTEVTTMWAVLAVATVKAAEEQQAKFAASRERARAFFQEKQTGESTEWWATRLLCEHRFGTAEQTAAWKEKLLARQQADGGWCWVNGDASDALATGQALYALAAIGLPGDHPAIVRARKFLLDTQQADGSWLVNGTKKNSRTKPVPTSISWGTAWAIVGLADTLP